MDVTALSVFKVLPSDCGALLGVLVVPQSHIDHRQHVDGHDSTVPLRVCSANTQTGSNSAVMATTRDMPSSALDQITFFRWLAVKC